MIYLIQSIAVLILFVAIFIPTVLLFLSALRFKKRFGGLSSWAVFIAALLFALLSLDVLYPMVLTLVLKMDAKELAEASILFAYIKPAVNYVALLLLGLGLWTLSTKLPAGSAS